MQIKNDTDVAGYLRRVINFEQEEFWVLCLTSRLELIASKLIFLGTVDRCLVHPRDIFKFAIFHNSSKIIIAHTHPLGDSKPSFEDIKITNRLCKAGDLLGIELIDHLVISKTDYSSCLTKHSIHSPSRSLTKLADPR